MRREWQPRGWYARAYTLLGKIGVGTIYGSAQYWSLLAGIPDDEQANGWSRTCAATWTASGHRRS